MTTASEMQAKVARWFADVDRQTKFINGRSDEEVVLSDGRRLKTMAKLEAEANIQVDAATAAAAEAKAHLANFPNYYKGDKGDPGGNVMAVGTLTQAAAMNIPAGTNAVIVTGISASGDYGAGMRLVYDPNVNAAYVANFPTTAFVDAAGRGFRIIIRETVSVTDYWRPVDADDTASFMRAQATGAKVFAPAGRGHGPDGDYVVDHMLLRTNSYIFGEGAATVIRPKIANDASGAASVCFYYRAPDANTQIRNVVLRDLQFYGRVEASAFWEFNHLVHVGGVRGMLVDNVIFKGFQGDGLCIAAGEVGATERHNFDVIVQNCVFDGVNRDNRNGISVIDVNRMRISGCRFFNCSRNNMPGPIDFEPDNFAFYTLKDVSVIDCQFDNCGGNVAVVGIFCGSDVPVPVGFTVRGCTVSNYVGTGAMLGYNNSRLMNGDAAINCRIHWSGNRFFGNQVNGRPFDLFAARGALVENNYFEAMGGGFGIGYALNVYPYAYARDITLRGNTFFRCTLQSGGVTGFVSNVDDLTIENNIWWDCGGGTNSSVAVYFVDNNSGARHIFRNNTIGMAEGRTIVAVLSSAYNFKTIDKNVKEGNRHPGFVNQFKAWNSDVDTPYSPVVEGSATAGAATYTRQQGSFRKRGGRVYFEVQIDYSAHTGSGLMKIALPPIAPSYVNDADIIPCITQVSGAGMNYTAGEVPAGIIHTYAATSISAGSVRMRKMLPNGDLGQMVVQNAVSSIRIKGDYACAE